MTPAQAARSIGCSSSYVRSLIQMGRIKAKLHQITDSFSVYEIDPAEIERFKKLPIHSRGVKRGSHKS